MDVLRVEYDVTGLNQDEINALAGEAIVQGESSDGHPGVSSCIATVESGCTGYFDGGHLLHDGDTCPVHEDPSALVVRLKLTPASGDARNADEIADAVLAALEAGLGGAPGDLASGNSLTFGGVEIAADVLAAEPAEIVVHLSGSDVLGVDVDGPARAEVRQHHADHMDGLGAEGEDRHGRYEVVSMVAAVSAAAPVTAGPPPGPAVHRGVRAWAEITDLDDGDEGDRHHVVVRFFADPPPRGHDVNVHTAIYLAPEGPTDA